MSDKKITAGQALSIGAQIATKLEGLSDITNEEAQSAIRNPHFARNMVAIIKNGGYLPTSFGKLETIQPLKDGGVAGRDFVEKARALAKKEGWTTLGNVGYGFYEKQENFHLFPDISSGINIIMFVEAQTSDGLGVRCFCRSSLSWWNTYFSFTEVIPWSCHVAVSRLGA